MNFELQTYESLPFDKLFTIRNIVWLSLIKGTSVQIINKILPEKY